MALKALEGIEALFVIAPGSLVHSWGMTYICLYHRSSCAAGGMVQHLPAAGPGPRVGSWAAVAQYLGSALQLVCVY